MWDSIAPLPNFDTKVFSFVALSRLVGLKSSLYFEKHFISNLVKCRHDALHVTCNINNLERSYRPLLVLKENRVLYEKQIQVNLE